MRKNDTAVWICSSDLCHFLWKNPAATDLWNNVTLFEGKPFSSEQIEQIWYSLDRGSRFVHWFSNDEPRYFECSQLPDGSYIFTEEDPAVVQQPQLIEAYPDENHLVSIFDQTGELITLSTEGKRLIGSGDYSFEDRFSDASVADTLWRAVYSCDFVTDYAQTKTTHGYLWHFLILEKVYLSNHEWVVRLTEHDADEFLKREKGLHSSLREQEVIFENAGVGICYTLSGESQGRKVLRCNQKFADIFGYDAGELIGKSSHLFYKDTRSFKELGNKAYPILRKGELFTQRIQLKRKDGTLFWVQLRSKIISEQNPDLGYMWVIEDIDAYIQANVALEHILREQNLIFEHAMVGIVFLRNRRVTRCNRRFEEIFGYESGELEGLSSRHWYLSEEDWLAAGEACYEPLSNGEVFEGEMLLSGKGERPIWCDVRSKAIDSNDLSKGSIWITMDITERKKADEDLLRAHEQLEKRVEERTKALAETVGELHIEIAEREMAEERVKHMALHDALTGLPNRTLMEERLAEFMSSVDQRQKLLAVLFIDLDRFKLVNDSWGHQEGDQLLIQVANRLNAVVGEGDVVARVGGDEFVILLPELQDRERAGAVIHKIQESFQNEVHLALRGVYVTPSIGVSFYPDDGASGAELLMNADAAMYQAKDQGRNCARFYEKGTEDQVRGKAELVSALFQALKDQQFELHYQPQVDVKHNGIVGVEALIRWRHPERGVISPAEFIPLAEETGLIVDLGYWILDSACQQLARWSDAGLSDLTLAVNLSSLQVQQPDFGDNLVQVIERYGIDPTKLELELTESIIMRNAEETIKTLDHFHQLGIKISVDDFGTGYSSLSYLKRLPLDKLKIDRSFVRDICTVPDDALICRTIISMAHNLNMQVIAEGVEYQEQLSLLKDYGCELYQGYLFAKPLPIDEIETLIRGHQQLEEVR